MGTSTRHSGRWTLEDRFASPWHYLPVEVPPGARAVRVELEYDRSSGVLDLGCTGPAGFRGWSGGARRSFVITAEDATPGYLGGELEPGLWQVMIGLYRLPRGEVEYRLTAEVAGERGRLIPEARPQPPPLLTDRPANATWLPPENRAWLEETMARERASVDLASRRAAELERRVLILASIGQRKAADRLTATAAKLRGVVR